MRPRAKLNCLFKGLEVLINSCNVKNHFTPWTASLGMSMLTCIALFHQSGQQQYLLALSGWQVAPALFVRMSAALNHFCAHLLLWQPCELSALISILQRSKAGSEKYRLALGTQLVGVETRFGPEFPFGALAFPCSPYWPGERWSAIGGQKMILLKQLLHAFPRLTWALLKAW